MASLSAPLIVPRRPRRMTRIRTRISHVLPTASIHRRGMLLRLWCYGVPRAGAPPAMSWRARVFVTRSEATVERWMGAARTTRSPRRSGPAEDRDHAGGGPEQEDRMADPGRRRLSGGLAEHSLIGRRRRHSDVRADSACGIYICTWAVTTTPKWY